MPQFLTPINMSGLEITNHVVHNVTSDPVTAVEGQIIYRSDSNEIKVCTNATGPVWTTLASGAAHDPITIGTDADVLLALSGQVISLDNQNANVVFAGPASGGAADPTFRSLVSADIPSLTDANIAAANKDGVAGTASMRTLGTGAQQAAAGNHTHTALGRYQTDVGNGSLTQFTITHSLNTRDVIVVVREAGSPYAVVYPDIEMTTVDTLTIKFAVAPPASQFRFIVAA